MVTFGTFYPAVRGCKTWREAASRPLKAGGDRVSYQVYTFDSGLGTELGVSVFVGTLLLDALIFNEDSTDEDILEAVHQAVEDLYS